MYTYITCFYLKPAVYNPSFHGARLPPGPGRPSMVHGQLGTCFRMVLLGTCYGFLPSYTMFMGEKQKKLTN
jgi:hypothetical protein